MPPLKTDLQVAISCNPSKKHNFYTEFYLYTDTGSDYIGIVDFELIFSAGDDRQCHNVNITDDDDCEKEANESFFSILSYASGKMPIVITLHIATRIEIGDTAEPECGK